MSLTLGIDLAAQPANTAACVISWSGGCGLVERLVVGTDDEQLTGLSSEVAMTAIDSPFGWPTAFVDAVGAWQQLGRWPDVPPADLRTRVTDREVTAALGIRPLSVSSDRIGVCAWRCARLLTRWGVSDRTGGAGVAEVYPAAALRAWQFAAKGYKRDRAARDGLVAALRQRCGWLSAGDDDWARMAASDHAFDALICALVGRAIVTGATHAIPSEHRASAEREGWIHLPSGDLGALAVVSSSTGR